MGTPRSAIAGLLQRHRVEHRDLFTPEVPRHPVDVDPFWVDPTPVTNAQFREFVVAQQQWLPCRVAARFHNGDYLKHWLGDEHPPHLADHPVVYVSWYAAVAYARWREKRLPTEAEWEFAARGGRADAEYPWGDAPADPGRANYGAGGIGATTPVGSYPPNAYGLYDLAGNVWEYCLDAWQSDFYAVSPVHDPVAGNPHFAPEDMGDASARRVIRGGSWGASPINLRVAYRDSHPAIGAGPHVGFRCVRPA